jgi:HEAT repeat protein
VGGGIAMEGQPQELDLLAVEGEAVERVGQAQQGRGELVRAAELEDLGELPVVRRGMSPQDDQLLACVAGGL